MNYLPSSCHHPSDSVVRRLRDYAPALIAPAARPEHVQVTGSLRHPVNVKKAAAAFTLIELLTVIAIIGILAAIIIPTVGKVRESARAAQCLSNIRQIAMALNQYADDNKGFFPTTGNDDWVKSAAAAGSSDPGIFDYLQKTANSTVYWTYRDKRFIGTPLCCPTYESRVPTPYSYGLNQILTERVTPKKLSSGGYTKVYANRSQISTPSQAMLVIESNQLRVQPPGVEGSYQPAQVPRHGNQINLAYVDTHVGKIKYEDISTSPTHIFWSINGN